MNPEPDPDPMTLAASLERLRRHLGTATPSALSALSDSWQQLLGDPLASRCSLHAIRAGTLVIETTDPAVAEQIRWMSGDVVEAANDVIGRVEISALEVRVVSA